MALDRQGQLRGNCKVIMVGTMANSRISILDTTMRDGELVPGIKMNIQQKINIAKVLEAMGVDVIEVGYPGAFRKDFDELFMVSKQIKHSIVCGLSSCQPDEIASVSLAIKPAVRGRIHIYTPINLQNSHFCQSTLEMIQDSVSLARNYCGDVEWSAFDATRSDLDFLCRAVETAIQSGATTINISDSFGVAASDEFVQLINMIMHRVPNIEQVNLSVHCHNDRDLAVENSIAAVIQGARQIECSINGLGARKGNADLTELVAKFSDHAILADATKQFPHSFPYYLDIDASLLKTASELIDQMTGKVPTLTNTNFV